MMADPALPSAPAATARRCDRTMDRQWPASLAVCRTFLLAPARYEQNECDELFRTNNPHPSRKTAKTPEEPMFAGVYRMLALFH